MITKRIVNVWRAVVGSGLTNLEANHAEEMLTLQHEELQQQVRRFNLGLAAHAGLCERLKAALARLDKERTQVEPKLRLRLQASDRVGAGRHALRLEAIAAESAQHTAQLAEAEAQYKELLRSREVALGTAKEKIESLRRSIGEYKVQRALADLTEMAAGMHGAIGLSDGTLDRVKERVDERRHFAAGRARVARESIDTTEIQLREQEQAAMAEAALCRFEARPQATTTTPQAATPLDVALDNALGTTG